MQITQLLSGGILLLLSYTIFTNYVFSNTANAIRLLVYFYSIIVTVLGFLHYYISKIIDTSYGTDAFPSYINFDYINFSRLVIIIIIGTIFFVYVVNLFKKRHMYLMLGTLLMLEMLLSISVTGKIQDDYKYL